MKPSELTQRLLEVLGEDFTYHSGGEQKTKKTASVHITGHKQDGLEIEAQRPVIEVLASRRLPEYNGETPIQAALSDTEYDYMDDMRRGKIEVVPVKSGGIHEAATDLENWR